MAVTDDTPAAVDLPRDDAVIVFRTSLSNVSGRLVRLGAVADDVLTRHAVPDSARVALGEALALSALLGSALPGEGKIILQTRTDGAVPMIVSDFMAPGRLRGHVRAVSADEMPAQRSSASDLGSGHLAITIEQAAASERYQGIVAIDGDTLSGAAERYFTEREGLATFVRLSVARHIAGAKTSEPPGWHWRAGGLMLQPSRSSRAEENDEDWSRVKILAATLEDHELLDPLLTPGRLLIRLFHEEGVVIERTERLARYCTCSREKVLNVLKSFGSSELADMHDENGRISARCEFCATKYDFDPVQIDSGAP